MPLNVETPLNASLIRFPMAITQSTSAASNGTVGHTFSYALYARVASNTTAISSVVSMSYTALCNASSNVSMSYNVITTVSASNGYGTKQSNSGGINNSADVHGFREFVMPFNTTLSAGEYWLAYANSSSAIGGTAGNNLRVAAIGGTQTPLVYMGNAIASNTAGVFRDMGLGIYRTTSGAFPGTVSFTQLAQTTQVIPRVTLMNYTIATA
jgi:hypothetical protein